MKKTLLLFLLIFLMVGFSILATAEHATVTFTGRDTGFTFQPGSTLSTTDLFPNFKNVMPGDRVTQTITVKNYGDGEFKAKIYMRALGAHPDSEEFLSNLLLEVSKSGESAYLFDSTADQTAGLTNWTLLGTLYAGSSVDLDVTLIVPVELDTKFKNTIGYLDWEFMVEEILIKDPVTPDTPVIPSKKDIPLEIIWNDNDNINGKRPDNVKVDLISNGKTISSATVSADTSWKHTFENVPAKNDYTVVQISVDGYTTTYSGNSSDGFVITNTYKKPVVPKTEDISVKIVWDDNDNIYNTRPDSVKVDLICDGKVVQSADVTSSEYIFKDVLPEREYTVVQSSVSGYTTTYSGNQDEGFVITNTYSPIAPSLTNVYVKIIWEDNNNAYNKRPDSVKIDLIADGKIIQSAVVDSSEYTFANVPTDLEYTVVQSRIDEYTTTYSGNAGEGFVITNTYNKSETKDLTVKIEWVDGNAEHRPDSVTITLVSDGKALEEVVVSAESGWIYTFSELDANIDYSVVQNSVNGYKTEYSVSGEDTIIITNTYVPPVTPPTGDTTGIGFWIAAAVISFISLTALIILLIRDNKKNTTKN